MVGAARKSFPTHPTTKRGPRRVDVSLLRPLSEAMGADKSPKEVLRLIVQAAHSVTRATSASLMLRQPGGDVLRVEVAEGFRDKKIYAMRLRVGQGVTGWVAESGVPLRLGNVTKDPRYVRVQRGLRSELAVPLKIRGRVIGVISVDSTRLNHFSAEDETLLMALAAQSARVIQTTRLYQETKRRAEALRLLIESGRALTGTLDRQEILDKLVTLAAEFWHAPLAAVFLLSKDAASLELAATCGATGAVNGGAPLPVKGSFLGGVLSGPEAAVAAAGPEAAWGGAGGAGRKTMPASDAGALLAAPLRSKKRALGVLAVFFQKKRTFEEEERRLISGLAASASLAIENAHFHRKMLETEEALRRSEKAALLAEMAGALSHEIRNPLTSIKLLFESMLRIRAIAPEAEDDARMVRRQIERLERIVERYLESARSHAAALQAQALDLNEIVDESLLLLAASAHEGTRIRCALHPRELNIHGDPTLLSQAVYNLILNAIQAVGQREDGRGRVDVRSGRLKGEGQVYLEVADDGPGLPAQVRERLFQPFVTTKKRGVGLGLSIVKRIVDEHGGGLHVESPRQDLGQGVRFRITLPATEPEACRKS